MEIEAGDFLPVRGKVADKRRFDYPVAYLENLPPGRFLRLNAAARKVMGIEDGTYLSVKQHRRNKRMLSISVGSATDGDNCMSSNGRLPISKVLNAIGATLPEGEKIVIELIDGPEKRTLVGTLPTRIMGGTGGPAANGRSSSAVGSVRRNSGRTQAQAPRPSSR